MELAPEAQRPPSTEFAGHSVLVHDGGPHITGPSPELVPVRITGVKEDVISGLFLIVAAIFCSPSLAE